MRGKKAKAIRKKVYGDMSIRIKEYLEGHEPQMMINTGNKDNISGRSFFKSNPVVICSGLRRKYQDLKQLIQKISRQASIDEKLASV